MRFHIFNNGLMVESGVSGSDLRALKWTKIFLEKGHEICLYTPSLGKKRYRGYGPRLALMITSGVSFLPKSTFFIYLGRAIKTAGLVKDVRPDDVLYSTSDLLPDALPALVTKIRQPRTKWVIGFHLMAPPLFKGFEKVFSGGLTWPSPRMIYYFLTQNLILLFARRYADLVLVSNSLDHQKLIRRGFSPQKVLVTHGAVDWSMVKKTKRPVLKYEASFIGRFHPQKGLDDLLLIWQIVCWKMKKAKLVMMGELEPLLPKIKEMRLEKNIDFLGFVGGTKKFEILKSSQIFLFPSTYESFGIVAAEAMACDLPVVAYDLPIYKDIYQAGMIKVPIGDYRKFAEIVLELLSDAKRRKKIAREAKKTALNFSWEKTAQDILMKLEKR